MTRDTRVARACLPTTSQRTIGIRSSPLTLCYWKSSRLSCGAVLTNRLKQNCRYICFMRCVLKSNNFTLSVEVRCCLVDNSWMQQETSQSWDTKLYEVSEEQWGWCWTKKANKKLVMLRRSLKKNVALFSRLSNTLLSVSPHLYSTRGRARKAFLAVARRPSAGQQERKREPCKSRTIIHFLRNSAPSDGRWSSTLAARLTVADKRKWLAWKATSLGFSRATDITSAKLRSSSSASNNGRRSARDGMIAFPLEARIDFRGSLCVLTVSNNPSLCWQLSISRKCLGIYYKITTASEAGHQLNRLLFERGTWTSYVSQYVCYNICYSVKLEFTWLKEILRKHTTAVRGSSRRGALRSHRTVEAARRRDQQQRCSTGLSWQWLVGNRCRWSDEYFLKLALGLWSRLDTRDWETVPTSAAIEQVACAPSCLITYLIQSEQHLFCSPRWGFDVQFPSQFFDILLPAAFVVDVHKKPTCCANTYSPR